MLIGVGILYVKMFLLTFRFLKISLDREEVGEEGPSILLAANIHNFKLFHYYYKNTGGVRYPL